MEIAKTIHPVMLLIFEYESIFPKFFEKDHTKIIFLIELSTTKSALLLEYPFDLKIKSHQNPSWK